MIDSTEHARRVLVALINAVLSPDEQERYKQLCAQYGEDNVFDTNTLQEYFNVKEFMAPYVLVIRKSDNVKGTLEFCHSPRFYYNFIPV